MKKLLAIFLSLLLVFSLSACGGGKPADNDGGDGGKKSSDDKDGNEKDNNRNDTGKDREDDDLGEGKPDANGGEVLSVHGVRIRIPSGVTLLSSDSNGATYTNVGRELLGIMYYEEEAPSWEQLSSYFDSFVTENNKDGTTATLLEKGDTEISGHKAFRGKAILETDNDKIIFCLITVKLDTGYLQVTIRHYNGNLGRELEDAINNMRID